MTRIQANLILLLTAAIWGAAFVSQNLAMKSMGPLWFVGIRFMIGFLVVLPFALREDRKSPKPLSLKTGLTFGLCGVALLAGAVTQQIGMQTTTVTNASFLTGLYVIIVPVLSVLILRKLPHWVIWPAAVLALAGIFYLSGGELSRLVVGDFWIILCAFCFGMQVLLVGIFVSGSDRPLGLSAIQFLVTGAGALVVAAFVEPITWEGLKEAGPHILYSGVVSSGIAYTLQVVGQRWTTAPQAAIFLSSESLFGAFFGALFLGERIPPLGYFGCALIFIAMLLVEIVPEFTKKRGVVR
ncbi:MAG: Permease of the drug/metabolite transporter superfamily [Rhizobium sp.]|nr:Permease of the drug/metabolite transporter superfamily [Rhizobium sp.]